MFGASAFCSKYTHLVQVLSNIATEKLFHYYGTPSAWLVECLYFSVEDVLCLLSRFLVVCLVTLLALNITPIAIKKAPTVCVWGVGSGEFGGWGGLTHTCVSSKIVH